ncbi:hypothetical protein PATSB16_08020 [Pandoraea thiooxydans]|nr:hypothetical protein PATSB16_08020 [Pandoraea thiooxydans]
MALLLLLARSVADVQVSFDTSLQTPLMLAFFATIGLNANLASLKAGGRTMAVFLVVVLGLLILQNTIGIGLASALGLSPALGLLSGSITLSGGHGTGAAWGDVFSDKFGLTSSTEVAMACATFGLVLGGLIGGPVARVLIKRVRVPGNGGEASPMPAGKDDDPIGFEQPKAVRLITASSVIETLALIAVSLSTGGVLAGLLKGTALELPTFVCVLFAAVILRNGLALLAGTRSSSGLCRYSATSACRCFWRWH